MHSAWGWQRWIWGDSSVCKRIRAGADTVPSLQPWQAALLGASQPSCQLLQLKTCRSLPVTISGSAICRMVGQKLGNEQACCSHTFRMALAPHASWNSSSSSISSAGMLPLLRPAAARYQNAAVTAASTAMTLACKSLAAAGSLQRRT